MSVVELATPLREIAASQPELAAGLVRLGLQDFERSDETLQWALETLGLGTDPRAVGVHAALWRDACDVCWQTASASAIVEHITTQHHEFLRRELPRIQLLLHRGVNREEPQAAQTVRHILDAFVPLKAEIEMHLLKEEQILFPLVRQLEVASEPFAVHCGSVRNPISVMMIEHENAESALRRIRELTGNFGVPAEASPLRRALWTALRQLDLDLRAHIREENDILFPLTIALEDELFQA